MKIAGSVALVTGANRGIGKSLVEALQQLGVARVYAAARKPEPVLGSMVVVPIALDITDHARVRAVAEECGDVQILINNAGALFPQSLMAANDLSSAEREMQVNYFGTLAMCRAFSPVLARNGGGAIANVLSILGRVSMPQLGSYSASKAAAYSLTQSIRAELAAQGTLVVGAFPAFVDTEMAKRAPGPKLSPEEFSLELLRAIEANVEDIYPGNAADVESELRQNPKEAERRMARLLADARRAQAAAAS